MEPGSTITPWVVCRSLTSSRLDATVRGAFVFSRRGGRCTPLRSAARLVTLQPSNRAGLPSRHPKYLGQGVCCCQSTNQLKKSIYDIPDTVNGYLEEKCIILSFF